MKKVLFTLAAILGLSLALVATSCGGGGGGSDDDDETPVVGSGSTGTGSGSSESGSGNRGSGGGSGSTGGSGAASGLVSTPAVVVSGAIEGSEVFIEGRTVEIWARWCCDHEVTQAEYESVMGANPSYYSGPNKPVQNVSWYDAIVYCNKKSIADGRTPCYKVEGKADPSQWGYTPHNGDSLYAWHITCDFTADGYRLPTEAEWEYFARGGNVSDSGQTTYSGSNTIGNVAWYYENAKMDLYDSDPNFGPNPVKTKAKNGKNLYDMSGNVREWCWDCKTMLITFPVDTPVDDVQSGYSHILRGGSWFTPSSYCTVSFRYIDNPHYRTSEYGFRVVCSKSEGGSTEGSDNGFSESGTSGNYVSTPAVTVNRAIDGSEVFIEGRRVEIWARWCCDHEVTQSEYQSVMGYNPSTPRTASGEIQENRPVDSVSWYDAIMYCNNRSTAEGKTPCYKVAGKTDTRQWNYTPHCGDSISGTIRCDFTADGYRLPTEAEWEYFARGGNTSNSGQTEYSGSNDIEVVAWYGKNSGSKTHEVKKKDANALDLYDMSGNVYEWCWDWYDTIRTTTSYTGEVSGSSRVLRGGDKGGFAGNCAVSRRSFDRPYWRSDYGFRVVSSWSE